MHIIVVRSPVENAEGAADFSPRPPRSKRKPAEKIAAGRRAGQITAIEDRPRERMMLVADLIR
jgi:hypothetical protein